MKNLSIMIAAGVLLTACAGTQKTPPMQTQFFIVNDTRQSVIDKETNTRSAFVTKETISRTPTFSAERLASITREDFIKTISEAPGPGLFIIEEAKIKFTHTTLTPQGRVHSFTLDINNENFRVNVGFESGQIEEWRSFSRGDTITNLRCLLMTHPGQARGFVGAMGCHILRKQ